MRSAPCCWITGSATPSSLIRLCKVVMFCLSAWSCTERSDSGLMLARTTKAPPAWFTLACRSGMVSAIRLRTVVAVASSCRRTSSDWPSRFTPPWRIFLSRKARRTSLVSVSMRLVMAACMSTCKVKCTPPRKSRPRYMGLACKAASQAGEREIRFSATTYEGSLGSGIRAFSSTPLALSCSSSLSKRARIEPPSKVMAKGLTSACANKLSTRFSKALSTATVALTEATCTAGASPKKFGRV